MDYLAGKTARLDCDARAVKASSSPLQSVCDRSQQTTRDLNSILFGVKNIKARIASAISGGEVGQAPECISELRANSANLPILAEAECQAKLVCQINEELECLRQLTA